MDDVTGQSLNIYNIKIKFVSIIRNQIHKYIQGNISRKFQAISINTK